MTMIEHKIQTEKYENLNEAVSDYRLMFNNCRNYNEEGSQIYDDAVILERTLREKLKVLTKHDKTAIAKA